MPAAAGGHRCSCFELPDEADNAAMFATPQPSSLAGHAATRRRVRVLVGALRTLSWRQPGALCPGSVLPSVAGATGARHAVLGRSGLQRLRALAPSPGHGRRSAVALWQHLAVARSTCARRGSFLSTIRPTGVGRAQAAEQAITVRVIEYALPGLDDAQPRYRLLTTLLDPQQAPAMELPRCTTALGDRGGVRRVEEHLRQSRLCHRVPGRSI